MARALGFEPLLSGAHCQGLAAGVPADTCFLLYPRLCPARLDAGFELSGFFYKKRPQKPGGMQPIQINHHKSTGQQTETHPCRHA